MKYIVAVSGGVDSVVLLHKMVKAVGASDLVVAHFDHGIRGDSGDDARFVEHLAKLYGVEFCTKRKELGANASESLARDHRYSFLREVAKKYKGAIVTAHHLDDLVETVAINLLRGTGWRGLAVLNSDVYRPLIEQSKEDIISYALDNNLEWVEDSTNAGDAYFRNRVRRNSMKLSTSTKTTILGLWRSQVAMSKAIGSEVEALLESDNILAGDTKKYSRYFFINIPEEASLELIRAICDWRLTRPQASRLILAIKTFRPGTKYEAGSGVIVSLNSRYFEVKLLK